MTPQVRTLLGDRLIYHTTASAPAAVDVLETLKVAFGTESSEVRLLGPPSPSTSADHRPVPAP